MTAPRAGHQGWHEHRNQRAVGGHDSSPVDTTGQPPKLWTPKDLDLNQLRDSGQVADLFWASTFSMGTWGSGCLPLSTAGRTGERSYREDLGNGWQSFIVTPLGSPPCTATAFSTAWQEQAEARPRFWVSADQLGQLKPVWPSWHPVWILLYLTSEVLTLPPNPSDPQPKLWGEVNELGFLLCLHCISTPTFSLELASRDLYALWILLNAI